MNAQTYETIHFYSIQVVQQKFIIAAGLLSICMRKRVPMWKKLLNKRGDCKHQWLIYKYLANMFVSLFFP